MVLVSVRTGEEDDPWTNLVSAIVAELPTDCDDPVERVARCRAAMGDAKRQLELLPAESIMEATQMTSPVVAASALRLVSRLKLADRVNLPVNVVISNVPGPRNALYFGGAKLEQYIPVSTITDNVGLNITVHSYEDRLDFGLVADRDLIPDLWHLVDLHIAEIEGMFEATGAEWAEPLVPAGLRRGGLGVAPVVDGVSPTELEERERRAAQRAAKKKAAKKRTAKKKTTKKASAKKRSGAKPAQKAKAS